MKRFPFAPGTIDMSARRNLVEGASRAVLVLAYLAGMAALLAFVAGCISLPGWLP